MRVVEERLRRNAANVQAGAAEGATLLNASNLGVSVALACAIDASFAIPYLHALLTRLDGRNVTCNTTSDDDKVLLIWLTSC